MTKINGELNSSEFSEIAEEKNEKVNRNRKEQRARQTFVGNLYMGNKLDIYNLEASILDMLIRHEEFVMEDHKQSFRFKLPTPKDVANIDKNATLEYKRGWKSGAQYMINLNR